MNKPAQKKNNILNRLFNGGGKAPERETDPRFNHWASSGEMEVCFTTGGISYYRFINEQRIPAYRAMAARDVFAELEFRTTKEMSLAYIAAIKEAVNQGDLITTGALVSEYEARHHYVTHIDLLYKLGTVLYMDNSENPEEYDPVYAATKMERWKEEKDVKAFFLQTPLIEYLPFSDLQQTDLGRFTALQRKNDAAQSKMLLSRLSPDALSDDTRAALQLLTEI